MHGLLNCVIILFKENTVALQAASQLHRIYVGNNDTVQYKNI